MPFLQAGFNGRNYDTGIRGWTAHVRDQGQRFAPAELRQFVCGDYFWHGKRPRPFLSWGECVVLRSHPRIKLRYEYQTGLAYSDLATRKEEPAWEWVEERRRALEPRPPAPPKPEQLEIAL